MLVREDPQLLRPDFPVRAGLVSMPARLGPDVYHRHRCAEITVIERGAVEYRVGGRAILLAPGSAIVFGDGEPHAWETETDGVRASVLVFEPGALFGGDSAGEGFDAPRFRERLLSDEGTAALLGALSEEIRRELERAEPGHRWMVRALLARAVGALLRSAPSRSDTDTTADACGAAARVLRARRFMDRGCAGELPLETAAAEAGMSPSHFSRMFRRAMGLSFTDYLIRRRIERAEVLLRTTDKRIVDVALESGFNSSSNFYRAFERLRGVSPRTLRRGLSASSGAGDQDTDAFQDIGGARNGAGNPEAVGPDDAARMALRPVDREKGRPQLGQV